MIYILYKGFEKYSQVQQSQPAWHPIWNLHRLQDAMIVAMFAW